MRTSNNPLIMIKYIDFDEHLKNEKEINNKNSVDLKFKVLPKSGNSVPIILQDFDNIINKNNCTNLILLCIKGKSSFNRNESISFQIIDDNGNKIMEYSPNIDLNKNRIVPINNFNFFGEDNFVNRAKEIVIKHLDDENFGVQDLSDALNLSRTQVYRKICSSTKMSPNEFIRLIRLEEAAQLLQENHLNVTEIAYKVGYSNPAYFINNFKKLYGQTPKQYQKNF